MLKALPLPLIGLDTVRKLYESLFRDFNIPPDTIIQFSLVGSERIEPLLNSYRLTKEDVSILEKSLENNLKAFQTASEEERIRLQREIEFYKYLIRWHNEKNLTELLDFYEKWVKEKKFNPITPSWNASVKNFLLYITVSFPLKNIRDFENPKLKERLWKIKEQIKGSFRTAGFIFKELEKETFIKEVRLLLNPAYETDYLLTFPIGEDEIRNQLLLNGSSLVQHDDGTFALQGYHYATYVIAPGQYGYPKDISFVDLMEMWGSLKGIGTYQISSPFIFSFQVRKLSDKEISKLNGIGNIVLKQNLPDAITKLKERKEDFFQLMQATVEEKEPVWEGILSFTLWNKDRDEVDRNGENFIKIASLSGYRFLKEEIPLPYFLSQIPGNIYKEIFSKRLGRNQIFLARNCPHMVPISADWRGTETPVVPLISRRGQLMFFHLWDTDGGSNYAIVAPMGAGKSFLSNHLLFNYALLPNSLIRVIDIGDSYWGLCQLLGGRYERFSVSKSCLNPFHFINPQLRGEGQETQIAFLVNLITALGRWTKPPTDEEKGLITQALLKAIERWGKGFDLVDVVNYMKEIAKARKNKELVEFAELAFTQWLGSGQYGNLLNGEPTLKFDNKFIVLELGEARDDYHLLAIVLISYLFMTTREIMTLPRNIFKILHIDEAWRVLQTRHFLVMDAIEQGIREYRKFGGALGIVSQYIKDLFPTDNDPISQKLKAMKNNIEFFFLFRQPEEEWERMREDKDIYLSDFEIELSKTVHTRKGEYSEVFVISRSRGRGIARVVVPSEFRWLYTTDPQEVRKREEVYRQVKDILKTIEMLSGKH